jgi:medium-chain acyl-[acyl-carrier-protein] hydrolase
MKAAYWEEAYRLRSYEVDFRNRLRLSTLFHFMQETASNQIEYQGVGIDVLRTDNVAWVLSRLLIVMHRYPGWGEEILVKTWPRGIERLFALREFLITSRQGEVLGRVTSNWLLVNLTTRRPKRLEEVFKRMPIDPGQRALDRRLEKLPPLESPEEAHSARAAYQQIDLNRHMNNAHYVGWILNSFSLDFHQRYQLASLQINFLAETRFGEVLAISRERTGEGESFSQGIEGRKNDGQTLAFQARLDWREDPVIS